MILVSYFSFWVFNRWELILWLIILHFSDSVLNFIADTNPNYFALKNAASNLLDFVFEHFSPLLLCCFFYNSYFQTVVFTSFAVQQFICTSRFQMFRHRHMRQPFLMSPGVNKGRITNTFTVQSKSKAKKIE